MTTKNPRPTLTLKRSGLIDEVEDRPFTVGLFDFTLPCRSFRIGHKVAEIGKVSVTAEFLLRLLKTVGSMLESDTAEFFGYNGREMSFVLREVEDADFVLRKDGLLSLTTSGQALFRPGSEQPAIYEVEQRTATFGFELLSLTPEERRPMSNFELALPELRPTDIERISKAAVEVKSAFRKFYSELTIRRDPSRSTRQSLYSIDSVEPIGRFAAVVRVLIKSNGSRPSEGEVDLTSWRPEFELSDRGAISDAVARVAAEHSMPKRSDDPDAYRILTETAPDFLKEFTRRDGLAVERFYKEAFGRAGDVRSDRPTVSVLGSLFTPENVRRLFDVANYGFERLKKTPHVIYWLAPQVPLWGSTRALPEILEQLRIRLQTKNEQISSSQISPTTVMLSQGKTERWVEKAFDHCVSSEGRVSPGGLELLLVPGVLIAALVHAPIGKVSGLPVPLGFVSYDPKAIESVRNRLLEVAIACGLDEEKIHDLVLEKIENSVDSDVVLES